MKNKHVIPTSQPSCEKVETIQTCIIGCEKLIINGENSTCCGDYKYKIIPQKTKKEHTKLDLDKLKSKVDNALANETQESLTEWLETQRMYSEEDMVNFSEWLTKMYPNQNKLSTTSDKRGFYSTKELLMKWVEQCEKKHDCENCNSICNCSTNPCSCCLENKF